MNKPSQLEPTHINVYGVVKPGVDPGLVNVVPHLVKLGWKFAEMPTDQLIDSLQEVNGYMKALEKWTESAKGILKGRLPEPEVGQETVVAGTKYEAHYTKSVRTDINREKVKAYFGDKYGEYCESKEILTLKITPIQSNV
jgi:hypothetical protein